jgi:hypothetical protein
MYQIIGMRHQKYLRANGIDCFQKITDKKKHRTARELVLLTLYTTECSLHYLGGLLGITCFITSYKRFTGKAKSSILYLQKVSIYLPRFGIMLIFVNSDYILSNNSLLFIIFRFSFCLK